MTGVIPDAEQASLTPAELAARWKTSTGTLANWRSKEFGPPYMKFGGAGFVRYRLVDIEQFEVGSLIGTPPI